MWDKHPPTACVRVNILLNVFVQNTNPRWVKNFRHVAVPPLLHMPLLEKGVIILRNWTICVGHGMSDLLKAPPRYDVIEADGGAFLGCNEILQKNSLTEWPTYHVMMRQQAITCKYSPRTIGGLRFFGIRYYNILDVIHELKLEEEVQV